MLRAKLIPLALSAFTATVLAGCSGPDFVVGGRELPEPDDPGLYTLAADDDLRRLDGSPEWEQRTWPERSNLAPDVEFIVFDPGLAGVSGRGAPAVRLSRVAWLRSELEPTGQAAPASGSEWVVTGLDAFDEPLVATPHPEIPGMVHLRPAEWLEPGLYELSVDGSRYRSARVGVQWPSLDKRVYSAAHCVDRMIAYEDRFQPCTQSGAVQAQPVSAPQPAQPQPASPSGLRITLAKPEKQNGGLTVRGSIVNTSGSSQSVPTLKGQILDGSGQVIDTWLFAAPQSVVRAGGEAEFTTWRPAPQGAAKLNVDFVG